MTVIAGEMKMHSIQTD